jgi:hypothetical protein
MKIRELSSMDHVRPSATLIKSQRPRQEQTIPSLPAVMDEAELGRAVACGEVAAKCDRSQTRPVNEGHRCDVRWSGMTRLVVTSGLNS